MSSKLCLMSPESIQLLLIMSLNCNPTTASLELDQRQLAMNLSDHVVQEVRVKFPPAMKLHLTFCEPVKAEFAVTVHMPRVSFEDEPGQFWPVNQSVMSDIMQDSFKSWDEKVSFQDPYVCVD